LEWDVIGFHSLTNYRILLSPGPETGSARFNKRRRSVRQSASVIGRAVRNDRRRDTGERNDTPKKGVAASILSILMSRKRRSGGAHNHGHGSILIQTTTGA